MAPLPAIPSWLNDSIAMRPRERTTLVHTLLAPHVRTYLEWGSGGSTELVAWLMLSGFTSSEFRAFSIESSLGWMTRMRDRSRVIRDAEKEGRPYVGLSRHRLEVGAVDLALVDGRFRLACLLELLAYLTPRTGRALLHDYSLNDPATHSRSEKYRRLLAFYRVAAHDGTLATLRSRPFVNDSLRKLLAADALREPI